MFLIAQVKTHPPLPKGLSNECVDFLKLCFKINPRERPNVIKLLNHKFISGIEYLMKPLDLIDENKSPQKPSQVTPDRKSVV